MRKLTLPLLVGALALAACSSPSASPSSNPSSAESTQAFDASKIAKDNDIAALVPEQVRSKGKLVIGASVDYAPAEFLSDDLKTPLGYDVELGKAIGRVLGLDTEVVNAEFASIIPAIGSKYDLGISSFTISNERIQSANMVSYIKLGSMFGVKQGNPKKVDLNNLCGTSIGVQNGTAQLAEANKLAEECAAQGKEKLTVTPYAKQSDVTTNLVGGKIDLMYADSQVTQYTAKLTEGAIEPLGEVRDAAPQGILISRNDPKLTEAIQKATQKLMDDGTWKSIAKGWGVEDSTLAKAELNPVQ